jgi:hypothetical protein
MNGRIVHEQTPEGRIAAVAKSIAVRMRADLRREPDYADYREALRPYIQRELLLARIAEARHSFGETLTVRMRELALQLEAINQELPPQDRL